MSHLPANATAAALLGFLQDAPMSGGELAATAQQAVGDFWRVTRSQVYRELAGLAAAGLVVAGEPGPRERTPYSITAAGRAAFRAWLRRPPPAEQIRFPLLLTLYFGRHVGPARLRSYLSAHRAVHDQRLRGYVELRDAAGDAADPYALAALDFGIRYETAVLEWFDHLPPGVA